MLVNRLSELAKQIQESYDFFAGLTALRKARRADPAYVGCNFCFDTAWGELEDGTIVPCPEHNGLCT
jgi:hypothetical protein